MNVVMNGPTLPPLAPLTWTPRSIAPAVAIELLHCPPPKPPSCRNRTWAENPGPRIDPGPRIRTNLLAVCNDH